MPPKDRPVIDTSTINQSYGPLREEAAALAEWQAHVDAGRIGSKPAAPRKGPTNLDRMLAAHRGVRKVPIW